ncbi:hypothetical protein ETD86_24870 [Nonomuraea turkmeniaca]|uniref:DUF4386 family protein n=1 Tax=Nonomuraea turkmeniaca TaxID=103838 RepID=A0A5S4FE10_9ACTN|nr:hypothetical protein [Nonomuraea turkmeniaca]TMR16537.1 hypothetical protein ETD86_24870 [Nonomuraea turkmeniaca]
MNSRFAFIAAPLLVLAYGVIRILDGLDGSRGPGVAWTTGHLAFIGALVLFVPIFWRLRHMTGRTAVATVSAVAGTAGIVTLIAQFAIDIVIGFMAADHDAMGPLFDQVQAMPGVQLAVYDAGPYLFYVAQLALVVHVALRKAVKAWTPVLVLVGLMLPMIDKDLIPVGAIFLLVSFWPLARREAPAARHALVPCV